MDAAPPRTQQGYIEDVARAIAAGMRRRPIAAAIAFGAVIVVTSLHWIPLDPTQFDCLVAAASFLAGAAVAVSRKSPRRPWAARRVVVTLLAVAVVAATAWLYASLGLTPDTARRATVLLCVVGWSFLLAVGPSDRVLLLGVAGLIALTVFEAGLLSVERRGSDLAALHVGWVTSVTMLLLARSGRWRLALPCAIAAMLWRESVLWDIWGRRSLIAGNEVRLVEILVLAGASVLLPVVAGRAAAALERGDDGDATARLVVRIQRHPWTTALVAVLLGAALFHSGGTSSPARLLVAVAGMSCLAHCAAGASFAALAPWAAAALLSLPLTRSLARWYWLYRFESVVLPEALIVLYVPVAVGAVVANARSVRWPWWGCAVALAGEAIGIFLVANDAWPIARRLGDDLALATTWCVVVSLLVHAVATSAVSARTALAVSPVASFVVIVVYYGFSDFRFGWSGVVPVVVAGPVAALLALAARRIRSMTALPEDHASFELGAARARALVPASSP